MSRDLSIVVVIVCLFGIAVCFTFRADDVVGPAEEACWFLTEEAQVVVVEDLVKWAEFTEHAEATMGDYYEVRIPEMLELWSSVGLTEEDARECLSSLEKDRQVPP